MKGSAGHLADETTVHGVKEAWHSNWCGRLFWAIVFVACFATMVVQLRGLFQGYLSESVGTRITQAAIAPSLEIPSAEYCNMRWLPQEGAFMDFLKCRQAAGVVGPTNDKNYQCFRYESIGFEGCSCCTEYWRRSSVEEVVNQLLVPTGDEVRKTTGYCGFRLSEAYPKLFRNVVDTVTQNHGGSLWNFIDSRTNATIESKAIPGHGIVRVPVNLSTVSHRDKSSYYQMYAELSNHVHERIGTISLGMNGVCWKIPLGKPTLPTEQAIDSKVKHAVMHFGGFGFSLKSYTKMYRIDGSPGVVNYFDTVPDCYLFPEARFATFMSLTGQTPSNIYGFTKKVQLNSAHRRVNIRFWTRKSSYLNTKIHPCKHGIWSVLDQAHCNQNRQHSVENGTEVCRQYLPPSMHYPETPISNKSCLHHHTGYFFGVGWQGNSKKVKMGPQYRQVKLNLVASMKGSNHRCPKPCSDTVFKFEIDHATASTQDNDVCLFALEAMVVNSGKFKWETAFTGADGSSSAYMKHRALEKTFEAMKKLWGPGYEKMPAPL